MLALGLESTCDETAAALVVREADGAARIVAERVASQVAAHEDYGGVVPEIAARAHAETIDLLIDAVFDQAGVARNDVDVVAAAAGPGLLGGVTVGLTAGKAAALALERPLVAVNHLEAHALTPRLTDALAFPYMSFLASGGHTQILAIEGLGRYRRLGATRDDAIGEAFDKTAKLTGLPQPGGPAIENAAKTGDAARFALPRPMSGRPDADMSFAGLKTAVRDRLAGLADVSAQDVADMAASFQAAVCAIVGERVGVAMGLYQTRMSGAGRVLVAAGGVAANQALRTTLTTLCEARGWRFLAPPARLCTDNAAMIAWTGLERFADGLVDDIDVAPRARWPLDPETAPAASAAGWGAKGAKA